MALCIPDFNFRWGCIMSFRSKFRFTTRDWLWLCIVVGVLFTWFTDSLLDRRYGKVKFLIEDVVTAAKDLGFLR